MNWKELFAGLWFKAEFKIHTFALTIAVVGPLINFWIKPLYGSFIISPYVYWAIALSIYVGMLIPFVSKLSKPLVTLIRLLVLGVPVEDFCSNIWSSIFTGEQFLPFCNWYAQYFPFFDFLGEPTPYILIPRWYMLALVVYFLLTALQYRKKLFK